MIRSGTGGIGDLVEPGESSKDWAKLSGRERDRILQSMSEGFPPEYRLVLERYYRRLAEEKAAPAVGDRAGPAQRPRRRPRSRERRTHGSARTGAETREDPLKAGSDAPRTCWSHRLSRSGNLQLPPATCMAIREREQTRCTDWRRS